jgi:glyoxylase-like metal-dependent hydrolase (beta-lactamase superfamily II)
MKVHFFSAGFCSADNSHTYKNAPKGKTVFPAFWALIQHPELGNIVFDTGYSEHFFNATKNFPNRIYRWVAPVTFTKGDSAKDQLESKMGISGEYIDYVIVSHFHGDHIGGLKDFPNARFICSKKAFTHFKNYPRALAFSKGYLKALLPVDFEERCLFLEDSFQEEKDAFFSKAWNWKESGIRFIDLPGHARGQVGIQFQAKYKETNTDFFFVADAAWCYQNIQENIPPPPLVKLFIDDYKALKNTLQSLHNYSKQEVTTKFIISHCKESLKEYFEITNKELDV